MRVHAMSVSLLMFFIAVGGCESVVLMPRPDVDEGDVGRDRTNRESDVIRFERGRDAARQEEVVGTVRRIDRARGEIQLRTGDRNFAVLRYDPRTVVYDRDRTRAVEDLREGDEISVQRGRGAADDQYADIIRMIDRRSQIQY